MQTERMSRKGKTARELAEKTGFSVRTIMAHTAEPRDVYLGRAEQRRQRIRAMRAQGMTMRAIATELGISVSTVHYALNRD